MTPRGGQRLRNAIDAISRRFDTRLSLHVEADLAQLRKELPLHDLFEVVDALRSAVELPTSAVTIPAAEHVHAIADPRDCRFDGKPLTERRPQFVRRTEHMPIGILVEVL